MSTSPAHEPFESAGKLVSNVNVPVPLLRYSLNSPDPKYETTQSRSPSPSRSPRSVATAPLPLHARGLIEQMKEVERTMIAAALGGSATLAGRALALHPLVPSTAVADRILEGYRAQEPHLAALLS